MSGNWTDDSSLGSLESSKSCYDYDADSTSDARNDHRLGEFAFRDCKVDQIKLTKFEREILDARNTATTSPTCYPSAHLGPDSCVPSEYLSNTSPDGYML